MWIKNGFAVLITVVWMSGGVTAAEQSLGEQCASKLTAVMTCVAFATGKEAAPQQKCCDSVKEMKDSNPACLCFVIQQIHNGTNPALQKMKIQESRLLQLPAACKIANASITDCPRLLKLPANSPDAAIFTSNSSIVPTTAGGMPSSTSSSRSDAVKYDAPLVVASIFIPVTLLLATNLLFPNLDG
ncbi:non-specific lipid transfer protein GPI-anchored 1-like [Cynara cardunculus var. scolymus]|uniref:Bifunctional inhibitor/plant lipid transfer protein/seed storage helical domain-containing protein n=1 Tax=Cynara cardunculus var. scolymus TaxID=59895 RepID=A0A103YAV8_CYNCS|nr:non-specific lipid transfer protein GPI-anchored 1-like [Cynara cardunculus var. scolymus]KVI05711.1 Bifunctional inhibitor/plant lipid transfer protein/seed storage helical domain-containing protein [Cynara cardunculus var. scolymus]